MLAEAPAPMVRAHGLAPRNLQRPETRLRLSDIRNMPVVSLASHPCLNGSWRVD
jgi:hypothetical protein